MPIDFEPVSIHELRDLWFRYRGNSEVRRVLLEVNHAREVMRQITVLSDSARKTFAHEGLGRLVALENLRTLLITERQRIWEISEADRSWPPRP